MRKKIHSSLRQRDRAPEPSFLRRYRLWMILGCAVVAMYGGTATAQTPFLGQIEMFAGNFAPAGWMFCEGQLLPISQYDALFTLIGTTYGGDGVQTFALPDLRGRVIVSAGQGAGLSNYIIGETGGAETVTLTQSQLPPHTHTLSVDSLSGSSDSPAGLLPADSPDGIPSYGTQPVRSMSSSALSSTGGNQPHNNVKPYLAIRYIIAVSGIYPSQN